MNITNMIKTGFYLDIPDLNFWLLVRELSSKVHQIFTVFIGLHAGQSKSY